ncbi:MAG: phosphoribosyl-ATP pyrophosphatase [marine bacterium B5-7]|nr:MAG: phosphoribosyl-ATP pyrophosphatase [marine bacterium B5-7]
MKQDILNSLSEILDQRKQASPNDSYTAKLFNDGADSILKKIGEEATEVIIASKSSDNAAIIHEVADLWFHSLVLLKHHDLDHSDILAELESRFGLSGLKEKANRKG